MRLYAFINFPARTNEKVIATLVKIFTYFGGFFPRLSIFDEKIVLKNDKNLRAIFPRESEKKKTLFENQPFPYLTFWFLCKIK